MGGRGIITAVTAGNGEINISDILAITARSQTAAGQPRQAAGLLHTIVNPQYGVPQRTVIHSHGKSVKRKTQSPFSLAVKCTGLTSQCNKCPIPRSPANPEVKFCSNLFDYYKRLV